MKFSTRAAVVQVSITLLPSEENDQEMDHQLGFMLDEATTSDTEYHICFGYTSEFTLEAHDHRGDDLSKKELASIEKFILSQVKKLRGQAS